MTPVTVKPAVKINKPAVKNLRQETTVKDMSSIIQKVVGTMIVPLGVQAIATALYTKGYRKAIL